MKNFHCTLMLALSLAMLLPACKDDSGVKVTTSCIQNKIDVLATDSPTALIAVYKTTIGTKEYFWFNTGAIAWDGTEYILDSQCDSVCYYCGFCELPACLIDYPDYGSPDWELVWKND